MRSGGMRRESHIWLWLLFIKPSSYRQTHQCCPLAAKVNKPAVSTVREESEGGGGLRRIRGIRAKCIQVTREEETLTITLNDKCNYFLKSYQQSAGLQEKKRWRLFARNVHNTFTQQNGKRISGKSGWGQCLEWAHPHMVQTSEGFLHVMHSHMSESILIPKVGQQKHCRADIEWLDTDRTPN